MRKLLLFYIIFFTFLQQLTAQKKDNLVIPKGTISFKEDISILNTAEKRLQNSYPPKAFPKGIDDIQTTIRDGDLILKSRLKSPKKKEAFKYRVTLKDQNNKILSPVFLNDIVNKNEKKNKRTYNTIIWKNITEGIIYPQQNYTLTYYVDQFRTLGFSCGNPPTFHWKNQLKYYLPGAILGGGIMLYSQEKIRKDAIKYYNKAEEISTAYTDLWSEGRNLEDPEIGMQSDKHTLYITEAERLDKKQKTVFYIGLGVLILDGLAYVGRWIKQDKDMKLYKEFCPNGKEASIQLSPFINYPSLEEDINQQLGFRLTYTF
jgi:hypothetical protein